jgi:hypothetical protein
MALDVAIGCSLCVLLLDLLLKFRMTAFRLSAVIAHRATASKARFRALHVAQLNHAEYAPCLAVLMMALRYLADRREAVQPKQARILSVLSRVGCFGSTLSWCERDVRSLGSGATLRLTDALRGMWLQSGVCGRRHPSGRRCARPPVAVHRGRRVRHVYLASWQSIKTPASSLSLVKCTAGSSHADGT